MTDQQPTTGDPMTTGTAVGTAPVQPATPELKSPEKPAIPPNSAAGAAEVLRWIADVIPMAGEPNDVEISTTMRQITVIVPNPLFFSRWQAIIGAVALPTRHDAIGALVRATTIYPNRWIVEINAHVRNPS